MNAKLQKAEELSKKYSEAWKKFYNHKTNENYREQREAFLNWKAAVEEMKTK